MVLRIYRYKPLERIATAILAVIALAGAYLGWTSVTGFFGDLLTSAIAGAVIGNILGLLVMVPLTLAAAVAGLLLAWSALEGGF